MEVVLCSITYWNFNDTVTILWKKRNKRHLKQQCVRETLIMILKLIGRE
jgi:hypothetical protein